MAKKKKDRFIWFKKLREYWAIPRYRALITLGLYFVFFGLIFLYIHIMSFISRNNVPIVQEIDTLTKFGRMNNYEYNYVLKTNILNEVYTVEVDGIRYSDKDLFKVSNYDFYVQNNIIYNDNHSVDIESILPVDLLKFRPDRLYEAIQYRVDLDKVSYQNGEQKITYKIPVNKFNVGFLQEINESNEVIEIVTYENKNEIYKLELDIYNLMKLVNPEFESYTVVIEYSNINNIKGIEN